MEELTQIIVIKDGSTVFSNEDPNMGGEEVFSEIVSSDGVHKYYILGFNSSGTGIVKEVSVFAGNPFDGGTGTDESPYLVSTPQQLSNVRFFNKYDGKVKYFLQTNDMNLDIEPWNTGEGWEPIDDFEGVYNGDGYKITNLFINRPNNNEVGLFSDSGYGGSKNKQDSGTIENLIIENGNITGHNLTGSVIGSGSRMNNIKCHNISIEGNDHLGGIAGKGYVFSNCRFEGFISGNNRIGGITSFAAELTNCYTDINISGNDYVGGMVGYSEGLNQLNISLSSSRGNITAEKSAGGFIGLYEGDSGEITDCYSRVNISGDMYIGGFSGRLSIWYGGIIDSYSTGSVTCSSSLQGGFNAYSNWDEDDVYNSYWDMEASGQTDSEGGEGRNTDEMKDPDPEYTYVGWNFQDIWRIDPLVNNGYPFLLWELTDIEDQQHLPETVMLEQNYPNPFNPLTKINYTIPSGITDNIRLDVYNSKGQLIRRLVDKKHNPGKYTVNFNASGLNSGIYFYALRTGNTVKSRKMVLLK
ncbi:MAG: T9SS type A sorting domain-containing protein [Candidatus Delongbacteria bacterium]